MRMVLVSYKAAKIDEFVRNAKRNSLKLEPYSMKYFVTN